MLSWLPYRPLSALNGNLLQLLLCLIISNWARCHQLCGPALIRQSDPGSNSVAIAEVVA